MRELHASIISTIDGFYETDGTYSFAREYEEEEFSNYANEMLRGYDTLLFGRKTYMLGIKNWQENPRPEVDADMRHKMNTHAKVVFSTTLTDEQLGWGDTTRYKGDLIENVKALKEQPGLNILVIGSTSIRSELLNAGLIDRVKISYFPLAVGSGSSLFKGINDTIKFKMMRAYTFHNGIVRVEYTVLKSED